jgi:beta-lactamase class A
MNINELSRRNILFVATSLGFAVTTLGACAKAKPQEEPKKTLAKPFTPLAGLEGKSGGRLGVAVLNTATGAIIGHRADERFAMCSTFKLPLCAVILHKADQGQINLEEQLSFSKSDMVPNSPVTEGNLKKGRMTITALCEATQTTSDNLAANLLVKRLGGPAALTDQLRTFGDTTTRIDRTEPEMNRVLVGDDNDTTTPFAMMQLLQRILTTDLLKPASLERLIGWMVATKTGTKRLRAGFPADWKAGNKTGTGGMSNDMPNRYNDVAIAWPAGKAPIIITSYYESPVKSEDMRDEDQAVLAEVARIAAKWVTT